MKLNCALMPSLQQVALQKVVTLLWTEQNIETLWPAAELMYLDLEYNTVGNPEDKEIMIHALNLVRVKVSKLPLPEQLKDDILRVVRPIGFQLLAWLHYHRNCCGIVKKLPTTFHWTLQGTVDNKAMAEMLVQDRTIDIADRFKFACLYCLVPDICRLWGQLSYRHRSDLSYIRESVLCLVPFWTRFLAEKGGRLNEVKNFYKTCSAFCESGILSAVESGNVTSTQYFMERLTPEEKERLLPKAVRYITTKPRVTFMNRRIMLLASVIPKGYYGSVLCLVLSAMNKEQQEVQLKNHSRCMLMDLLDWHWYCFLKLLERTRAFLSPTDYFSFVSKINFKVVRGYEDQEVFTDIWKQIPVTHIDHVIDLFMNAINIEKFFQVKENVILILKEMDSEKRAEFLLSRGKNICLYLICQNFWDTLKSFVQICAVSKEMVIKFKGEFDNYIVGANRRDDVWEKFFKICEELTQSFEKRKIADNHQPAKKICKI